jgi:formylglycine-generating enzyme required for sulfatase activity
MTERPYRVGRGGCANYSPQYVQDARCINGLLPDYRSRDIGIRLVEVLEDPDPEPASAAAGYDRVFRGSCSGSELEFARVTNGNFVGPGFRSETIGLRLVEVVDE